jgi:hypothetical protein
MSRYVWICAALLAVGAAVAAIAQQPTEGVVELQAPAQGKVVEMSGPVVKELVTEVQYKPSKYWIGVECFPAVPALRAQLNLPEKQGLQVLTVVPDSPAAKAGLKEHDVLMKAGDKPLGEPIELVEAVEAAKGGKLKLELIRGGKPQTIEVATAERPKVAVGMAVESPQGMTGPADWDLIRKWFEEAGPGMGGPAGGPPVRFRFFQPGAIVPKDADVLIKQKPMPANMSIVITKEGDKPAKIVVRRGDEKWEVTEKELDPLPEDVRPFVERMLGRHAITVNGVFRAFDAVPDVLYKALPGQPQAGGQFNMPAPPPGQMQVQPLPGIDPRIERRLDEMNRRMDKLFEMLQRLHGEEHQPEHKDAEQ